MPHVRRKRGSLCFGSTFLSPHGWYTYLGVVTFAVTNYRLHHTMARTQRPTNFEGFIPDPVSRGLNGAILSRFSQQGGHPEERVFSQEKNRRRHIAAGRPASVVTPWMTYIERRPADSNDWVSSRHKEHSPRDELVGDQYSQVSQIGAILGSRLTPDTRASYHDMSS